MNRSNLEHLIRAAANITGDHEIVIIGSQAIHGTLRNIPNAAQMSSEADMYPRNMPEKNDLIDVMIGEDSDFHDTHSYYAQGVGPETAVLPIDWEKRSVRIQSESTNNAVGVCVGLHDLVLSKYAAGREKDFIYVGEIISLGAVDKDKLLGLVGKMPSDRCDHNTIRTYIKRDFKNVELHRVKSKIGSSEVSAINAISRMNPEIGMDLLELREQPGFRIEKILFEKPESPEDKVIQDALSGLGRGDMLHIADLKKNWVKLKSLDPSVMPVNASSPQVINSEYLRKSADLPKGAFPELALDPKIVERKDVEDPSP